MQDGYELNERVKNLKAELFAAQQSLLSEGLRHAKQFEDAEARAGKLTAENAKYREALENLEEFARGVIEFCDNPNRPCNDYGAECPIGMGEFIDEDDRNKLRLAQAAMPTEGGGE
jgi:hypothetical protein